MIWGVNFPPLFLGWHPCIRAQQLQVTFVSSSFFQAVAFAESTWLTASVTFLMPASPREICLVDGYLTMGKGGSLNIGKKTWSQCLAQSEHLLKCFYTCLEEDMIPLLFRVKVGCSPWERKHRCIFIYIYSHSQRLVPIHMCMYGINMCI